MQPVEPHYVLYWMQQSQRVRYNHALEYAVAEANDRELPLVVLFVLTNFPEANARHYTFMLEGLRDVEAGLKKRGIGFHVEIGNPAEVALRRGANAAVVIIDRGYLRIQEQWRQKLAGAANFPVICVESDVVVPVDRASDKEEFAARTLRPRIHRLLNDYVQPLAPVPLKHAAFQVPLPSTDLAKPLEILRRLKIDRTVESSKFFRGGELEAQRRLDEFVKNRLTGYDELRNEPALDHVSNLSPYLHFGQISPVEISLEILKQPRTKDSEAFLEELIVRRELSMNFVRYNPDYDTYESLPDWARRTLQEHARDLREFTYSLEEFEAGDTHDPYWNAAQREMVVTGKMHNTMRMYWGKKILEWSRTPQEAYEIALHLNNKYHLDGRDANSYAGVAWCFGKHDRPWNSRPVFGTVRYMNAAGLTRKYDMKAYVGRVAALR